MSDDADEGCPYACDDGLVTSYGANWGAPFFLPDEPGDPGSHGISGFECRVCGPSEAWRGSIEERWAEWVRAYKARRESQES